MGFLVCCIVTVAVQCTVFELRACDRQTDRQIDMGVYLWAVFDKYIEGHYPVCSSQCRFYNVVVKKGKGSPYSITERRVPELIPVLGSQPAGDVSHKPGSRLPLLSARPAVTSATLKRAATSFAAW